MKDWVTNPYKLIVILSILFLLTLAGIFFSCYYHYTNNKQILLGSDKTTATLLQNLLSEHQKASIAVLQSYANRASLVNAIKARNGEKILIDLAQLKNSNEEIDGTYVSDGDGILLMNYLVDKVSHGKNLSYRDWYKGVSKEWKPYISKLFRLIIGDKELAVAVCVPVFDEKGKVIGILGNTQRVSCIADIINEVPFHTDTKVTLTDEAGQIIYSNTYPYAKEEAFYPLLQQIKKANQEQKDVVEIDDPEHANMKKRIILVDGLGWTIIVERADTDILRAQYGYFFYIAAFFFLFFAVISLSLVYMRKNFLLMNETEKRLNTEKKLKEKNELFSVITSSTPDHLIVQDSDLRYSFVMNPQLGLTEQDMIGKTDHDITSKEDADKLTEVKRQVLNTGLPTHVEVPLKSLKGEQEFFEGSYIPKFDAKGQIDGLIGYFKDITERKRAEEKIHASLREKEILLNEIHHRVKNNMQVISSLLKLQASASGSPELKERLNESQSRIHAMALIHEKLYDAKDFTRIDLTAYVRSLSNELFLSFKIGPGEIDVIVKTDGDVYLDVNKAIPCGLILNELISNALKHAFPGGRHGELQITIRETENAEIEIVVQDNGLGLPDEVDIHAPRSLGLDLVNGLVKNQLDGQIEVRRDKGTEFRIKFPL